MAATPTRCGPSARIALAASFRTRARVLSLCSESYQGCLDKAVTAFDYAGRCEEQQRLRNVGHYRGIGVAAYTEMCGMAPSCRLAASGFDRGGWESARVAIDSSGRATVYSGSMSQGHGQATVLAQIAAAALQMPVENIDVVQGDTKLVQAGHGTFNSRSMPVGGSSVKVCAGRIVEKAKRIVAEMMEVAAEDLAYEGGSFVVPGTEIAPLAFAKVARMAYVGVRRDKAALFQWVQAPPGDRSSRKRPEQTWRRRSV